ncbi:alpha/beta hydrolase [Paenibacillus sp. ACRSA]|uniref:alpha/beta fold hydrolase n=1 Tax=Paenibacillus sp. ACRSA TaxID=2918211 RepID=UPI001EF53802|nr:alpha/beta hydrolase [Paenibacillus sp. ACRSA]
MIVKKKNKILIILKRLLLFILSAVFIWIGFHHVMKLVEQHKYPAIGQYIQIENKRMHVYTKGNGSNTIVLLSGLGTASPVLDFEPLINEMSKHNRVVVLEPFGYGWSDRTDKKRTVEHIVGELRSALKQLNIKGPYVLMPHSISGIYSMYYAHEFPDEVKAIVGIDATLPAALAYFNETPPSMPGIMRYAAPTGLARLATSLDDSAYLPLASEGAYSNENLAMTKAMTAWNGYNSNIVQEANELVSNVKKTAHMSFPSELPVLFFTRDDGRVSEDGKSQFTFLQTQLTDHTSSTILPLKGHHYLHWTKYKEMSEAVLKFLKDIGNKE